MHSNFETAIMFTLGAESRNNRSPHNQSVKNTLDSLAHFSKFVHGAAAFIVSKSH
jgi:hypothetical protein